MGSLLEDSAHDLKASDEELVVEDDKFMLRNYAQFRPGRHQLVESATRRRQAGKSPRVLSTLIRIDPLIATAIEQLHYEDKTVRDPVHGDILLNHLEVPVIDTEVFQRLRRLRQLGTAHFVYPGAEHSRFQHSLGALHMTQSILRFIKENRFSDHRSFGNDQTQDQFFALAVRLGALIHDLDEFPLSHVLEKEGSIFRKQWEDENTNTTLLGLHSEIYQAIRSQARQFLDNCSPTTMTGGMSQTSATRQMVFNKRTSALPDTDLLARRLAATIIVYTYKLIKNSEDDSHGIARKLFKSSDLFIKGLFDEKYLVAGNQIILNTISADLLDYSRRDFFFCGIGKNYDERFLKYAAVVDGPNGPVFGYRLLSKRNEIKSSVLSSLLDVLELRYALAEFVHTHHTKNMFSAMAIEAFSFYYYSLDKDGRRHFESEMANMGDDELLYFIRDKNQATRHILEHYYRRNPYDEVVLVRKWDPTERALKVLRNPEERLNLEKCVVEWFNKTYPPGKLVEGDVLVYAMPSPEDLYKELDTYVVYLDTDGSAKAEKMSTISKRDRPYAPTSHATDIVMNRVVKQREELIDKYGHLWRVSIYVCPDVTAEVSQIIRPMVEHLFLSLQFSFKIPEAGQIPTELFTSLSKLTQGAKRSFKTFKELFDILSAS